jgi:hypothetical protein
MGRRGVVKSKTSIKKLAYSNAPAFAEAASRRQGFWNAECDEGLRAANLR